MNEQYKCSKKQELENTLWIFFLQMVLYMPSILGALVGMMLADYSEKAIWIGFGIGFVGGAIGWWFMPEKNSDEDGFC